MIVAPDGAGGPIDWEGLLVVDGVQEASATTNRAVLSGLI